MQNKCQEVLTIIGCNSRYMILDLKHFTPGQELPAGLLWVAEQIPGLVASADVTEQLARGYWPSDNIPYFPHVLISCYSHGIMPLGVPSRPAEMYKFNW